MSCQGNYGNAKDATASKVVKAYLTTRHYQLLFKYSNADLAIISRAIGRASSSMSNLG